MKRIRFRPFGPLTIGAAIIFIGALLKILKMPYSKELLIIGLLVELIGIIYFIYRYRIMRGNEVKMQNKKL
jgi:hypothetical protein